MYVPKHFEAADVAWCHDLIRREPFAILVGTDQAGVPFATHLPVLLDETPAPLGAARGTRGPAEPPVAALRAGPPGAGRVRRSARLRLPVVYAQHPSVPTWNYVAVHAYGVPRVIEDPGEVRALLERLVRTFEDGRSTPWRMDSLADTYLSGMMRGIVAFEIPITRLEGKAKLSQNRPAGDQARVRAGLGGRERSVGQAVAALMPEPGPR